YYSDEGCKTEWLTSINLDETNKASASVNFIFDKIPSVGKLTVTCSESKGCSIEDIDLDGNEEEFCTKLEFTKTGEYTIISLKSTEKSEVFVISPSELSKTITVEANPTNPDPNFKPSGVKYHSTSNCSSEIVGTLTLENGKAEAYAEIIFDEALPSDDTLTGKCGANCSLADFTLNSTIEKVCTKLEFLAVGNYNIIGLEFEKASNVIDVSLLTKQIVVEQQLQQEITVTSIKYYSDEGCETEWLTSIKLDETNKAWASVKIIFDKIPSVGKLTVTCSESKGCSIEDIDLDGNEKEFCTKLEFTKKGEYTIKSLKSTEKSEVFVISPSELSKTIVILENIAIKSADQLLYSIILLLSSALLF
ncbi:MAG: hypothetical protein ACRC42_01945, partial [Mycoplasma sp.]